MRKLKSCLKPLAPLLAILTLSISSDGSFAQRWGSLDPRSMPTGTGILHREDDFRGVQTLLFRPTDVLTPVLKIAQAEVLSPDVKRSLRFRDFLRKGKAEEIVCQSFQELFGLAADAAHCLNQQYNAAKTIFVQVVITDDIRKIYEIEVRGKSELLALRIPNWTERHRFFVLIGFGGDMLPYLLVWDAEAHVKNTPNIDDTDDRLYQNVDRTKYDLIRSFQEKAKSIIARTLRSKFNDSEADQ